MEGILNWNIEQAKASMKGLSVQEQNKIIRARNVKFELLRNAINIKNIDEPLNDNENDPELGLRNPYSKITCFILYLYSMEFGSPPLYAEINRVARDMDLTQIYTLGALLRALSIITAAAERSRTETDKIKTGEQIWKEIGGEIGNFAGSFVMFRGAHMKQEWLDPWLQNVREDVNIPGSTSCSQSLKVALGFSGVKSPKADYTSVLFLFCIRNYYSPSGVRMNNEAYTSFPVEGETLFTEGMEVRVLGVEEHVVIDNKHATWQQFNQKPITIIYLYHPDY